jgi:hypothetical protein
MVVVRRTDPGRRAGADAVEPRGLRSSETGIAICPHLPERVPLAQADDSAQVRSARAAGGAGEGLAEALVMDALMLEH